MMMTVEKRGFRIGGSGWLLLPRHPCAPPLGEGLCKIAIPPRVTFSKEFSQTHPKQSHCLTAHYVYL
jgi:hypothetical protein